MFIFFLAENKGQVLPLGRILNTLLVPRMLTLKKNNPKHPKGTQRTQQNDHNAHKYTGCGEKKIVRLAYR